MSARARHTPAPSQSPDFLASVSDLMSGLIFIFIITIAVFTLRLAKATTELTDAEATRKEVVNAMAEELRKEGIDVTVDPEQGVLRLTDRAIRFPRGESVPEGAHHRNVGIVANVLLRVLRKHVSRFEPPADLSMQAGRPPHCGSGAVAEPHRGPDQSGAKVNTVLVEGHTDNVPISSGSRFRDNLDLSAARGTEVFRMMQDCEPELAGLMNRTGSPVLSVSGYGDTRPIDREHGDADANRRIDLRFLMEPPQANDTKPPAPLEETRQELAG